MNQKPGWEFCSLKQDVKPFREAKLSLTKGEVLGKELVIIELPGTIADCRHEREPVIRTIQWFF